MVLGIDTSGKNLGLALCDRSEIIGSSLTKPGLKHGEIIQNMIEEFLSDNKIRFGDLTGISVTLGPGSFTGLRIGLAVAKGYCYALDIPVTGISTLQAAAEAADVCSEKVIVVLNARKDEFYWASFDCSGDSARRLSKDTISSFNNLKKKIDETSVFVASSHLEPLFSSMDVLNKRYYNDDLNLAVPASRLGEHDFSKNRNLDASTLVPFYLRTEF